MLQHKNPMQVLKNTEGNVKCALYLEKKNLFLVYNLYNSQNYKLITSFQDILPKLMYMAIFKLMVLT